MRGVSQLASFPALRAVAFALLLSASASTAVHAGMFDDDEARKQILLLRNQTAESQRQLDQRVAELEVQARNRSIIDLFNQVETLKAEIARQRGQIELLQNELENTQKRQRDLYVDVDGRMRKMEAQMAEMIARATQAAAAAAATPPAPSPLPSATASMPPGIVNAPAPTMVTDTSRGLPPAIVTPPPAIDPVAEQRAYDQGLEHFRAGRFSEAVTAFQLFSRNFPRSTLVPSAQYWIGNSLYAVRDFRGAITTQRQLIAQYPESAKAPDALLNIATVQSELGDLQAARATLQEVASKYPNSEAGAKAKQRLGIR
jgi:tol-pal system protein YbgF